MLKNKKHTPLLFIADLGNEPMVKFIQSWSDEEITKYQNFLTALENKAPQSKKLAASSIYTMVKKDLPSEHAAQFLLSCLGVVPYWSQTPIASRLSAGLAAKEILQFIPCSEKTLEPIRNNPVIHMTLKNFFLF